MQLLTRINDGCVVARRPATIRQGTPDPSRDVEGHTVGAVPRRYASKYRQLGKCKQ
jgi:hypothetical protein